MNAQDRIAAEQNRRRIPTWMLTRFDEQLDGELAWLSNDDQTNTEVRAFARWELEYREAFGISVFIDDEGELKRTR